MYPFTEVNVAGIGGYGNVQYQMPVSEDVIIVMLHSLLLFAPDQQKLFIVTQVLFGGLTIADPALSAPEHSDLHAKIWVYSGKKPLAKTAREKLLQ